MDDIIHILLIDDNPYFLNAAADFLQLEKSFKVVGMATEGQAAIHRSAELQPDIILLDLNLAECSGLSLIPQLKTSLPGTRIIVLTIMEEAAFRSAALEAGADDFISKKSMSRTLVSAIQNQMDGTRSRRMYSGYTGRAT